MHAWRHPGSCMLQKRYTCILLWQFCTVEHDSAKFDPNFMTRRLMTFCCKESNIRNKLGCFVNENITTCLRFCSLLSLSGKLQQHWSFAVMVSIKKFFLHLKGIEARQEKTSMLTTLNGVCWKEGNLHWKRLTLQGLFPSLFCYVNVGYVSYVRYKVAVAYNVPYSMLLWMPIHNFM